jgi:hypothetical protein
MPATFISYPIRNTNRSIFSNSVPLSKPLYLLPCNTSQNRVPTLLENLESQGMSGNSKSDWKVRESQGILLLVREKIDLARDFFSLNF